MGAKILHKWVENILATGEARGIDSARQQEDGGKYFNKGEARSIDSASQQEDA